MLKKLKSKLSKAKAVEPTQSQTAAVTSPQAQQQHIPSHVQQLINSAQQANPPGNAPIDTTALINTSALLNNLGIHPEPKKQSSIQLDVGNLRPYRYSALPSKPSFRLLEFSMDEIGFTDDFRSQKVCRLVTFERAKAPPYLCLSYTWGSPVNKPDLEDSYKQKEPWVLAPKKGKKGGWTSILVGQNLGLAMKHIFKSDCGVAYIWIDALCINQDDKKEKSVQLGLMGDIYAQSLRTVVWLGEGTVYDLPLGRFVMIHTDVLPKLVAYAKENGVDSLSQGWDEHNFYERLALSKHACDWKAYIKFYDERTYFDRTWIIQEIAFSKSLVVLVSNHILQFGDLSAMARFLRVSGLDSEFLYFNGENDRNKSQAVDSEGLAIMSARKIDSWSQIRQLIAGIGSMDWLTKFAGTIEVTDLEIAAYMLFAYVLGIMRSADAFDPKDKVFAAFSFLQGALKPLGIPPRFQPNYLKTVEEVYNEIGMIFLEILPDFAILSEAQGPNASAFKDLATWLPDYSFRNYQSLYAQNKYTKYNAGGATMIRARLDTALYTISREHAKPILSIHQCHLLDTVVHIEERPPTDEVAKASKDLGKIAMIQRFTVEEHIRLMSHLRATSVSPKNDFNDWQTLFETSLGGQLQGEGRPGILPIHFKRYMLLSYWERRSAFEKMRKSHILSPEEIATITDSWLNDTEHTWAADAMRYPNLIHSWDEMTDYWDKHKDTNYMLDETAAVEQLRQLQAGSTVYINAAARTQAGRHMFATECGRLGLGPVKTKIGDRILIIKGARMAYVVRPYAAGEKFSLFMLVGECYLHSVMNGEVLDEIEEQGWSAVNLM